MPHGPLTMEWPNDWRKIKELKIYLSKLRSDFSKIFIVKNELDDSRFFTIGICVLILLDIGVKIAVSAHINRIVHVVRRRAGRSAAAGSGSGRPPRRAPRQAGPPPLCRAAPASRYTRDPPSPQPARARDNFHDLRDFFPTSLKRDLILVPTYYFFSKCHFLASYHETHNFI